MVDADNIYITYCRARMFMTYSVVRWRNDRMIVRLMIKKGAKTETNRKYCTMMEQDD
jgi:hypothetical protein